MPRRSTMLRDRVTCPICGRRIGRAYLHRHKGSPTCLAYRDQGERAKARQKELIKKEKAQLQGYKCPRCGYDYGPFARPFFEGARRRRLSLECAACFGWFVLKRDGSAYPIS